MDKKVAKAFKFSPNLTLKFSFGTDLISSKIELVTEFRGRTEHRDFNFELI